MNKGRSLQSLLRDHSISADEFLQTPGISSQIRSHLTRFVDYCRTHRNFTIRMLTLALNISYVELDNQTIKNASHTANEILGNQEPQIAELFFESPKKPQPDPETTQPQPEPVSTIQSEAQRLFSFDSEEEDLPPEEPRPVEITGQEMITLSFDVLKNPEKNETCLGHLQKIYSFFIRHDPIEVLGYFQKHSDMLELLLKNLQYSSVSSLLAQLLTSQDKDKQYKYEALKKTILERVVQEIFKRMDDQYFFDGALVFLDQILNATKQSYYQYFEDFKKIANYLVSKPILQKFYDELMKLNEPSFCSSSRFLQSLFSRMHTQAEDSRYYHKEEPEQTMHFEIELFIDNITQLIKLTPKTQTFSSITRINYLSFLDSLLKIPQFKQSPPSLSDPSFMSLFEAYKAQSAGGICKSKIYTIMTGLISRAEGSQVKQFLESHPEIYEQYFTTIKNANYANTKVYNKNQTAAFDLSLISKLTQKEESALANASKVIGKDMKRLCKKYDTKIASFQNNSNSFSSQEESNFYQYSGDSSKGSGLGGGNGFNLNLVGKNNISIPVLHLPERFNNIENKDRERSPEEPRPQLNDSPKQIIEVEEVVSLTDKINSREPLELRQVISEEEEVLSPEVAKNLSQPTKPEETIATEQKQNTEQSEEVLQKNETDNRVEGKQVAVVDAKAGEGVKLKKEDGEKARFYSRHLAIFA